MRIVIAIPALNEAAVLRPTVEAVLAAAASDLPGDEVAIVIADNGSTDRTEEVGRSLAAEHPAVRYLRLAARGKGLAIRAAWTAVAGDVYAFMDADLSTDLAALPELVRTAAASGGLAVGSRFHPASRVERNFFRGLISHGYRLFISAVLGTGISDLPCGFKAASAEVIRRILPAVEDNGWFFDTELAIRTERAGFAISEIPVVWREDHTPGRRSKVVAGRVALEYVRRSWRLRRQLAGAAPPASIEAGQAEPRPPVSLRGFLATIKPTEWRLVASLAFLAVVVTSAPPLYALWLAHVRGLAWTGRQFLSPGDTGVYLSYIEQAKQGRWIFDNLYTTEKLKPVFNVLWLGVGWLARLGLPDLAAYHLARILLIPVLAVVIYVFIAYCLRPVRERAAALILLLFGSGWGIYFVPFFTAQSAPGRYEWPIDLWVGDGNVFLTMLYSPHFIASLALLLAALFLFLFAIESGRCRHAVAAGLVGLILFEFHPFHAPTLYAVPAAWLLWQSWAGGWKLKKWLNYAIFIVISCPAVAYHYYLTHYSAAARALADANLTLTPAIWHILAGFGLVSILWLPGYFLFRRRDGEANYSNCRNFLLIWILVQTALAYSPLTFQRRLLEGLEFPLVVLAVPAIMWAVNRILPRLRPAALAVPILAAAILVFFPSTAFSLTVDFKVYESNQPPIFFLTPDEVAAFDWLRQSTPPDAVILSSLESGNIMPGWTGRRVYVGHWAGTIDVKRKNDEAWSFFGAMSEADKSAFIRKQGITYVYCGSMERSRGGCPTDVGIFVPVFRSGDVEISKVR